ncbi:uncharacterized protein LOC144664372 [Oculina patagonica]
MRQKELLLLSLLIMIITLSGAFQGSALKDNKHSKTTLSVTINDTAIIPCPVLAEVINKDGKFDLLSWKICTSERCDDQDTTWGWLGGMNHKGTTKVSREGIKINSDGALEIKNVQLGDTGRYMCTIKRIRHTSPKRHFVALTVNRVATADQERQTTNKTDPLNCKKDYSDDSGNLVCTLIAATCVLSVLLVLAVGYIVYLKRSGLCCGNQRNASV